MPKEPTDNHIPSEREIREFLQAGRLHGASADARLAAKELDAALSRYAGTMARHYQRVREQMAEEISADLIGMKLILDAAVVEAQEQITQQFADLADTKTPDELLSVLVQRCCAELRPIVEDATRRVVDTVLVRRIVRQEITSLMRETRDDRKEAGAQTLNVGTVYAVELDPNPRRKR